MADKKSWVVVNPPGCNGVFTGPAKNAAMKAGGQIIGNFAKEKERPGAARTVVVALKERGDAVSEPKLFAVTRVYRPKKVKIEGKNQVFKYECDACEIKLPEGPLPTKEPVVTESVVPELESKPKAA